ncbi:MAG: hypothetical protein ACFFEF_16940 [Candidatus Thorarchaeota archaeon]
MNNQQKVFTFFLVFLVLTSSTTPMAVVRDNAAIVSPASVPKVVADTTLIVENETINYNQAFNDDDFVFHVYNGTSVIALANVTLYNNTDLVKYDSKLTVGDGSAVFYNVPQGIWEWNVTWSLAPGVFVNGTMVSNGPDAVVDFELGNLDWQNNDDDILATVTDIDGNPGTGLNFSVYSRDTNSTYDEIILGASGIANITNIPEGNYTWYLTVQTGDYAGYVIDSENFIADGTTIEVWIRPLGNFAGNPGYYDLEIFTYFETSHFPLEGALANLTYYNGTEIDHQYTPANGTVTFLDLPVAFVNWTVSYLGTQIWSGYRNLTTISTDIRAPILTTANSTVKYLYQTENITVTWFVEDEFPSQLKMYVGATLNETITWTNQTSYTFNATGFEIGIYELKLVALDLNTNTNESIVSLRVFENVTPTIEGPDDIEFYFSESGKSLRWNFTDDWLDSYVIYRNNYGIENGTLDREAPFHVVSLDGLAIGVYNYSLWINDTSGNSVFDNVTVTVKIDDIAPVITYEPPAVYYARGDRNIVRNWTAQDEFKERYTITVDSILVVDEEWTSEAIEFDFWGLTEGEHDVVLTVSDIGGNTATSTVKVYVGMPVAITAMVGTVGIVAIVVVIGLLLWYFKYR